MRTPRLSMAVVAAAAAVLALSGAATPTPDDAQGPYRDTSGLLVVPTGNSVVPESLRDVYGMAVTLSQENPDDFSVPTLSNGQVLLGTAGPAATKLASANANDTRRRALDAYLAARATTWSALTTDASKLRAPQMSDTARSTFTSAVSFVAGARSRAQTFAISDAVFDLQFDARYKDAHIWESEVDPFDGSVVLTVEALAPQLAAAIVAAYGVDTVHVRIGHQPESSPASRPHDTSPYYGGGFLGTPTGTCTGGFGWTGNTMVSAGHCLPTGGNVAIDGSTIGTVTSGSSENWTTGNGTVYLTGSSSYRGDISLIALGSGKTAAGRIFRGDSASTTSAAVGEMWSRSPVAGGQYCTGGSISGEVCGWAVDKVGIDHTYSNGEVLRSGVQSSYRQGWCVRHGDSGGPVYTVRSDGKVAAKGIISGDDFYGGATDPCIMWFTDIYHPYYAFPGSLVTY